ncbi:MAG: MotA/TolQ/ExbB proton channel family protein [Pirellulales bacterium]|nr:MotA/TolQ/ExbB proton channel family protein [Pirellulales bacterium]
MLYLFAQAVPNAAEASNAAANAAAQTGDLAARAGDLAAQAADASAAAAPWYQELLHSGALGYLIEGGLFMWIILAAGILAAGVIIERFRSLKMLGTDTAALRRQVLDLLQQDRVEEALALCDGQQGPVPAILSTGLRKFLLLRRLNYDPGKIEEQVVKAMDDYGVHIVAALERHLPILATVSSVAPMLGFLGTVQGMVIAFRDIVARMGQTNIVEAAASGIQVALLTTVLGLMVGIPAFTAYNYFTSVINRFVLSVEETAAELIEAVTLQMALGSHGASVADNQPATVPASGTASSQPSAEAVS